MKIIDDDGQVIAEGHMLTLEPGDVICVSSERKLNMAEKEHIVMRLEGLFPNNKIVVMDEGAELTVLRQPVEAL